MSRPGTRGQVLVTDGGNGQNRSAVAAVRALAAGGFAPVVTVSGPGSLAAASRFCARTVAVPPVDDRGYADAVRHEVARSGYAAVLPASDAALVALDWPGHVLVDKSRLAARAAAADLPVPPEQAFDDGAALLAAADDLPYPVVVKPAVRTSSAQPPVQRAADPRELATAAQARGPLVVQPFVPDPMTAVAGVVWRGRLAAVVHQRYLRTWPTETGTASALVTVDGDRRLEERLAVLLEGHEGVFQAQFVGRYLVDVNPRVYGSLPLAVAAGANLPSVYADLRCGCSVPFARGATGVRYRWVEGDVRAVLTAWRRHERGAVASAAALLPRRGTAHSTESLLDPGPAVARLRHGLRARRATRG
ncbi:MAG TPA: hypothetical protein VNU26_06470 [Mycobacteriales bacterium]|nr:hypothetical protein [Mycobacteriales bacterium]